MLQTDLPGLELVARGKVRDVYAVGTDNLLIVSTDRVSAFDVINPKPVAGRGKLLTEISLFWFDYFRDVIPNHLVATNLSEMPSSISDHADQLEGRSMLVHRAEVLPVECVARGYIAGSGWKDYQATSAICGVELPAGLQQAQELSEPIFTPATKAEQGEHDENISFERMSEIVGTEMAERLRKKTLEIYIAARDYARIRGILLADTKFEFGLVDGQLTIVDEMLTPDSSRYWDASQHELGISPLSFDKQIIRDWLETQDWDKTAPAPALPDEVIERAVGRYREVITRLKSPSQQA